MSEAKKGGVLPQSHKLNISKSMKGRIPKNFNTLHTAERNRKRSKTMRGKNNPAWRGGVTPLLEKIRHSSKYQLWKQNVFYKDDFTCQRCNRRGGNLNAHHKKSFTSILKINIIKTFKQAMDVSELWDIDNGITLCEDCHNLTKRKGEIMLEMLNKKEGVQKCVQYVV